MLREQVFVPALTGLDNLYRATLINPWFIVAVSTILCLERLFPANRKQRVFSVGFFQDSLWLVHQTVVQTVMIAVYALLIERLYQKPLGAITGSGIANIPFAARFVWGMLSADFLAWVHHWIRHRVPLFWRFHKVHHSQREVNMFTDARYHFVDYLASRKIIILPFLMLNVDISGIALLAILHSWHTQLYHANIKTNFGFLRYVLVSRQHHRIHHSIESRHQDYNFGVLFTFWDRIFGTQYQRHDEYPETGIGDQHFPHDKTVSGFGPVGTLVCQLIYPFHVSVGR